MGILSSVKKVVPKLTEKFKPTATNAKTAAKWVGTQNKTAIMLSAPTSKESKKLFSTKAGGTALTVASAVVSVYAGQAAGGALRKLGAPTVAKMAEKAIDSGVINSNSVKQTLVNNKLPNDPQTVKALTGAISTVAAEKVGTSLPVQSIMTKTEASKIMPNLTQVIDAVSKSGVIDKAKIVETLQKAGNDASAAVVNQVAKTLNVATPNVVTPIIDSSKPQSDSNTIYVVVGIIVALVAAVVLFFKFKKR